MSNRKDSVKRDYHMHPQITRDPEFAEHFITSAVKLGFNEICITDHCPVPIDFASDRILNGKMEDYVTAVRNIAEKYRGEIVIRLGLEVDYFPQFEEYINKMLSGYGFDYILGSSHIHLKGYGFDFGAHTPDQVAEASLKNTLEAVKSGFFDTVAHLDMYRWYFNDTQSFPEYNEKYNIESHKNLVHQIFKVMQQKEMLIEINSMGLRKIFREQYPQKQILEWAKGFNLGVVFGSDAHVPEHVGYGYEQLKEAFPQMNCFAKKIRTFGRSSDKGGD